MTPQSSARRCSTNSLFARRTTMAYMPLTDMCARACLLVLRASAGPPSPNNMHCTTPASSTGRQRAGQLSATERLRRVAVPRAQRRGCDQIDLPGAGPLALLPGRLHFARRSRRGLVPPSGDFRECNCRCGSGAGQRAPPATDKILSLRAITPAGGRPGDEDQFYQRQRP